MQNLDKKSSSNLKKLPINYGSSIILASQEFLSANKPLPQTALMLELIAIK